MKRGFEIVQPKNRKHPEERVPLPKRSSKGSAGYDFYNLKDVWLAPQKTTILWTDIKAYMGTDEVLMIYIRSSLGIKKGLVLSNGTGIIDSDYYSNEDNDGNIGIAIFNNSNEAVFLEAQERFAQGIFMSYLVGDEDDASAERKGGMGSSGQ